jgi:hypothetical protein
MNQLGSISGRVNREESCVPVLSNVFRGGGSGTDGEIDEDWVRSLGRSGSVFFSNSWSFLPSFVSDASGDSFGISLATLKEIFNRLFNENEK